MNYNELPKKKEYKWDIELLPALGIAITNFNDEETFSKKKVRVFGLFFICFMLSLEITTWKK